jgi:hypothetical protein
LVKHSSPKRIDEGSNPSGHANLKEKEMDEELLKELQVQLEVATLMYSFLMMGTKGKSDEEVLKVIKDWSKTGAEKLVEGLGKKGFVIVPKEPAFDSLLTKPN